MGFTPFVILCPPITLDWRGLEGGNGEEKGGFTEENGEKSRIKSMNHELRERDSFRWGKGRLRMRIQPPLRGVTALAANRGLSPPAIFGLTLRVNEEMTLGRMIDPARKEG